MNNNGTPAVKLSELFGMVEYDMQGGGVGQARMSGKIIHPRTTDDLYPHPYRYGWDAKARAYVTVRQLDLENGSVRPITEESN